MDYVAFKVEIYQKKMLGHLSGFAYICRVSDEFWTQKKLLNAAQQVNSASPDFQRE